MGLTLTEKIIKAHIIDGEMVKGTEIGLKIDQTLTQDATGTMAYLQFEAMGVDRVKTERSVAYIDHNTLQSGFENAYDHRFIGSVAKISWFSSITCRKERMRSLMVLTSRQRYLPSGTSRALRQARQDPYRLRQPHPDRRRYRHAGNGRRRS